jgi:hypothetical protein
MTRKQDGQINYNAKACYNCILPNLASLISQRFGVHGNEVRLHHHLLKNMQYHVAVPKSQQEWTFKHSQNQPIYETGQGNGNSPHIWTMISSVLFVDDVNTHHSGDSPFNTLFENMQHKYIQWKKILEVSRGKLSDEISTF